MVDVGTYCPPINVDCSERHVTHAYSLFINNVPQTGIVNISTEFSYLSFITHHGNCITVSYLHGVKAKQGLYAVMETWKIHGIPLAP